jgi:hypothetical protein
MQAGTFPHDGRNKSGLRSSVFFSEYEIMDRVQKGNNAKYQGSHSTSLAHVVKAITI